MRTRLEKAVFAWLKRRASLPATPVILAAPEKEMRVWLEARKSEDRHRCMTGYPIAEELGLGEPKEQVGRVGVFRFESMGESYLLAVAPWICNHEPCVIPEVQHGRN